MFKGLRDFLSEDFVKVATVDEIPEGAMKTVDVGREQAVIANIRGRYQSIGAICTHQEWDLSEGNLEEDRVTCAGHGAVWDLKTGEADYFEPLSAQPIYEVKVDGSDILLKKKAKTQ